ncbi:RNase RNM [Thalassotalea mangrovi]|uniref:PHP domain-containing protein n=1 Tax=Thalassotalea mangrovi TaxID=2572245 RepID=A0A4U1B4J4_9GAMM|nr:PHP domain-containing protein [Thalassotalea mangrovi]TKB45193.1 PHP domain-containing protein [Thalassotalea mangrovi]
MPVANASAVNDVRVDLHSHTQCSDGHLTVQELIDRASTYQIDQLAITDHDTVAGIAIAKAHIVDNELPIRLINGIEVSTSWQGFEIHIVGLNFDENHQAINELVARQQQTREQRALQIGEKLAKAGFSDAYNEAKNLAGGGSITRAHFAKVLLLQGHVSGMQKAFDKYLGKGKRAYVKPGWVDIEQAVTAIRSAGGIAVIAHPMKYGLSTKWLRRLIVDFKAAAGQAMEVASPQMSFQQQQLLLAFCKEYELLASVGSDFHYPTRWSDLGRNLNVPEDTQVVWQHW